MFRALPSLRPARLAAIGAAALLAAGIGVATAPAASATPTAPGAGRAWRTSPPTPSRSTCS